MKALLAVIVLAALVAVSLCQIPSCTCISVPAICSAWANYTNPPYSETTYCSGVGLPSDNSSFATELQAVFDQLGSLGLCGNCVDNLKKFLCRLSYPRCQTETIFGFPVEVPQAPTEQNCEDVITSCVPSDAPAPVQTAIRSAFGQLFQSFAGSSNCSGLYTQLNSLQSETGASVYENMTDIEPEANCNCSVPSQNIDLTYCNDYVDLGSSYPINYPVWTALLGNGTMQAIEAEVTLLVNSTMAQLSTIPGGVCVACERALRLLYCSQAFPQCDTNTSALFMQPCSLVCDHFLSACRLDEIDSTVLALLDSQNVTLNTTLLDDLTNTCTNATLFAQGPPCGFPNYDITAKCPCLSSSSFSLTSECANYVDWDVSPALGEFIYDIDASINDLIAPFLAYKAFVCDDCWDGLMTFICASAFPTCNQTNMVLLPCADQCQAAVQGCRMPVLSQICDAAANFTISNNNSSTCINLNPVTPCSCVAQQDLKDMLGSSSKCYQYVNYDTFPGATSTSVALLSAEIDTQINSFNQFLSVINCPDCAAALTRVACQLAFPQCDATDAIIPMCQTNCADHVATCGVSSLTNLCNTEFTNPYALLNISRCFNVTPANSTGCEYCSSVYNSPTLPNCGKYADWETIKINLGVFKIEELDGQIGAFFSTINLNCTECADQIKRTLCSIFILPCNATIIDNLVSNLLALNASDPNSLPIATLIPLLSRPCKSTCLQVFDECLSTAPPNVNILFSCNTRFPDFPAELFSNDSSTCYVHDYPPLPPADCPVLRGPSVTAPAAPTAPSPDTSSDESNNSNTGAIAGGVIGFVLAVILTLGIVGFVLWKKKKWIFAIPKPMAQSADDFDTNYDNLPEKPRDTWQKPATPSARSVELKNVKK